MTDKQLDDLALKVVELAASGAKIEFVIANECKRCGSTKPYKSTCVPNWMNRFTCQDCGRNESR